MREHEKALSLAKMKKIVQQKDGMGRGVEVNGNR